MVTFLKMSLAVMVPHALRCLFIRYKEKAIGIHRLDLRVENKIVVELKAVKVIDDAHLATCRSHLKATGLEGGLMIHFSRSTIRVRRVVCTTA